MTAGCKYSGVDEAVEATPLPLLAMHVDVPFRTIQRGNRGPTGGDAEYGDHPMRGPLDFRGVGGWNVVVSNQLFSDPTEGKSKRINSSSV